MEVLVSSFFQPERFFQSFVDQVFNRLSEPAAVYVLWPTIAILIFIQFFASCRSKPSPQSKKFYFERNMWNVVKKMDNGTAILTSDVTGANEKYVEEQTSFSDNLTTQIQSSFLTNDSQYSEGDESFRYSLPKVQPDIIKFSKRDFADSIGIRTTVKDGSLFVRKVIRGSAACGRVCAGDRISAINGFSFIGLGTGEKLKKAFEDAVCKAVPFEITIVKGSRLSDVGIHSKHLSSWFD